MARQAALVITVDGLGAALLGPYGNTWASTPELDQLASQSVLVEFAMTDSWRIPSTFRSFWQGRHAWCPDLRQPSIAMLCRDQGIAPVLISDDKMVLSHSQSEGFHPIGITAPDPAAVAGEVNETQFARFVDQTMTHLAALPPRHVCWIHARGFSAAWDAPVALRQSLCDESDPAPYLDIDPPVWQTAELDPDQRWAYRVAYAAQLGVIDHFLGILLEEYSAVHSSDTGLAMITAPRAYPLGEHGVVGNARELNYSEQLHVPFLIRGLESSLEPQRVQAMVQPPTVFGTLADWLQLGIDRRTSGAFALSRQTRPADAAWQRAASGGVASSSLRTPAWFLRTSGIPRQAEASAQRTDDVVADADTHCSAASNVEVFAKPDDRWEVNEVSSLVEEVTALLLHEQADFRQRALSEQLDSMSPLALQLATSIA